MALISAFTYIAIVNLACALDATTIGVALPAIISILSWFLWTGSLLSPTWMSNLCSDQVIDHFDRAPWNSSSSSLDRQHLPPRLDSLATGLRRFLGCLRSSSTYALCSHTLHSLGDLPWRVTQLRLHAHRPSHLRQWGERCHDFDRGFHQGSYPVAGKRQRF